MRNLANDKRIVILTGSELRHKYVYSSLAATDLFETALIISEGIEESLYQRVLQKKDPHKQELAHVCSRMESEERFFRRIVEETKINSPVLNIPKGMINHYDIFCMITSINPDVIICYGSSIIKKEFLNMLSIPIVNVHLGLSPYYRGSGTNIWALINKDWDLIGTTFMMMDEGIDTGEIFHQIRARIYPNDTPHDIGNRLITDTCNELIQIISNFEKLTEEKQIKADSKLYLRKDFDIRAIKKLNSLFTKNELEKNLIEYKNKRARKIVENSGLRK